MSLANRLISAVMLLLAFTASANQKDITFAFAEQPPYVVLDKNGYPSGDYVELAMAVAKALKLNFEFWSCPFERCLELIKNAKADIMIGLEKHPEMQRYMSFIAFSDSPSETLYAYYQKSSQPFSLNLDDYLEVRPRNLPGGALYFHHNGNNISYYKSLSATTIPQYFRLLASGKIDMIVSAKSIGDYLLKQPLATQDVYAFPISNATWQTVPMIGIARNSPLHQQMQDLQEQFNRLRSKTVAKNDFAYADIGQ